jgi:hypothetical protein
MNGDETNGGKRVSLMPGRLGIQKVRVYRHE